MRCLILLPLVAALTAFGQEPRSSAGASPVEILQYRWSLARITPEQAETPSNAPQAEMIPANKNFQRNARQQGTRGTIDPNDYTIDGRSAALEKIVQNAQTPPKESIDGYAYRAVFRNASRTKIELIFWEYQFTERAKPSNFTRRQFLCVAKIKPDEKKELGAFSRLGPSGVINTASLANNTGPLFDEAVVINRIEYSNGAILQRGDWDFNGSKAAIEHLLKTPWGKESCRAF
jgi:hypothetical protein